jgi:hypothetical protein
MIEIKTDNGSWLDLEDSKRYISIKIEDEFSNISEFRECVEINDPSYWGEYSLIKNVEHYSSWINLLAEIILKE